MNTEKNRPDGSGTVFQRLLPFVKPYRLRLLVGVVCGILYGTATFSLLIALGWALGAISGDDITGFDFGSVAALDKAEGNMVDIGLRRLLLTVSLLPVITVFQGLVFFGGKYLVEWVGNRVIMDLRNKLFSHIHALPIQFFGRVGRGT